MNTYDISIIKGSSFSVSVNVTDSSSNPIDLTNYSVRGLLRNRYSDLIPLASLNPSISSPATSGGIVLSIPSTITSGLPVTKGVYDIEIYDTGTFVLKVLRGYADINPEATY